MRPIIKNWAALLRCIEYCTWFTHILVVSWASKMRGYVVCWPALLSWAYLYEVQFSLMNSLMERIGERTLELWGDLFVSVYGKRWNWWANWWAKRCFTCELVSESRVGAWICDPFNLRDWATCCEVWSHILGLFGIFWEISLDKVPGYVWAWEVIWPSKMGIFSYK